MPSAESRTRLPAALLLAAAAGCGATSDDTAVALAPVAVSAALAITATSVANDDLTVTYGMTYTGVPGFFRVYVDADQSPLTGLSVGGAWAEWLVENGALYRYTGTGLDWSWLRVKAVDATNDGRTVSFRVARADLRETNPCAESADLVFDADDARTGRTTQRYRPTAACAPAPGAALSNLWAGDDASSAPYRFSYAGAPDYFRVYVDADQNPATGFPAAAGVGGDYLLENASLYRHLGPGWSWSRLGAVTFATGAQAAQWTVERARIGETAGCGERSTLLAQTQDADAALHSGVAFTHAFADLLACGSSPPPSSPPGPGRIQYVFVIAMENEPAAAIYGSASAPYINGQIIPRYARATAFRDPLPDSFPSEPHYVWMEAGTSQFADASFATDLDPTAANSTASGAHLASQMRAASPEVSWLAYQEGIGSATGACPVHSSGRYAAKHDPFVFFQDVAGNPPSASNPFCASRHRAYTTAAFAADLQRGAVARYNFITPDLCNDMHGAAGCPNPDVIRAGDDWLRANLPPIIDFAAAHDGAIFVVWDEPIGGSTLIPFLAIGPHVKRGYAGAVPYDHGAVTKSVEEIFGLPILPAASAGNDFRDLFEPGFFP